MAAPRGRGRHVRLQLGARVCVCYGPTVCECYGSTGTADANRHACGDVCACVNGLRGPQAREHGTRARTRERHEGATH
eukprot:1287804-Prymnesium_polylepis.1